MKVRYFVVDGRGQLRKAPQAAVKGFWDGSRRAEELGCASPRELRLISVVCDDKLLPQQVFLVRLPLTAGSFTAESLLVLKAFTSPDCVTPQEARLHHTAGWPPDFFRQLAVALDVPVAALEVPFGIGGPFHAESATRAAP